MKILNCTPHVVNLHSNGNITSFEPAWSKPIRVKQDFGPSKLKIEGFEDIRITTQEMGITDGLPEPQEGVFYIVSIVVLENNKDRHDLLAPAGTLRNAEGQVYGCTGFHANI